MCVEGGGVCVWGDVTELNGSGADVHTNGTWRVRREVEGGSDFGWLEEEVCEGVG